MKTSKILLSLVAFAFAIGGAIASNSSAAVNYYGENSSGTCVIGTPEAQCGQGANVQCSVTIAGSLTPAFTESTCTTAAMKP